MTKRFTDPNKWDDDWFCQLSMEIKILWIYITDKCNHAGIWKANKRLAEFQIAASIDWQKARDAFNGRVFSIGEYWFIPKFLTFHYGSGLTYGDALRSAVKLIDSLGFSEIAAKELGDSYQRVMGLSPESLGRVLGESRESLGTLQSKSISKSKSVVKREEVAGEERGRDFDRLWLAYPRREGRKEAERSFRASVKTPVDLAKIEKALANYVAYLHENKTEPQYFKMGSTWFNNWQDWVEYRGPGGSNADTSSAGVSRYAAIARAAREAQGLRKVTTPRPLFNAVGDMPDEPPETGASD